MFYGILTCSKCGEQKFSFDTHCSECMSEIEDSSIDDAMYVDYNEESRDVRAMYDED